MPYLIDGNNLLGSWGGPAGAVGSDVDARTEVVRRVAAFCRSRGAKAVLVFDGAPFRPELGTQELGLVSLRFPERGRDADSLIREILDRAPRAREFLVVTSDRALYSYALTRGASVVRAHEWNALSQGRAPKRRGLGRRDEEKPERETDIEGWLKRFSGE